MKISLNTNDTGHNWQWLCVCWYSLFWNWFFSNGSKSTSLAFCETTFFFPNNSALTMLLEGFTMCCMNCPVISHAFYILIEAVPLKWILGLCWNHPSVAMATLLLLFEIVLWVLPGMFQFHRLYHTSHCALALLVCWYGAFGQSKLWISQLFKTCIAIKKFPFLTAERTSWERYSKKLIKCCDPFLQKASYEIQQLFWTKPILRA